MSPEWTQKQCNLKSYLRKVNTNILTAVLTWLIFNFGKQEHCLKETWHNFYYFIQHSSTVLELRSSRLAWSRRLWQKNKKFVFKCIVFFFILSLIIIFLESISVPMYLFWECTNLRQRIHINICRTNILSLMILPAVPWQGRGQDILWQSPTGSQDSVSLGTLLQEAAHVRRRSVHPLHHSASWWPLPVTGGVSLPAQHVGIIIPLTHIYFLKNEREIDINEQKVLQKTDKSTRWIRGITVKLNSHSGKQWKVTERPNEAAVAYPARSQNIWPEFAYSCRKKSYRWFSNRLLKLCQKFQLLFCIFKISLYQLAMNHT